MDTSQEAERSQRVTAAHPSEAGQRGRGTAKAERRKIRDDGSVTAQRVYPAARNRRQRVRARLGSSD